MKFSLIIFLLLLLSCSTKQSDPNFLLRQYNFDSADAERIFLPEELKEISGLAFSEDGRLFAHTDECNKIFQINPLNGEIIKILQPGNKIIKDDFEGIAIVKGFFYLVTSDGNIHEFPGFETERENQYKFYETFLDKRYDVEGLCYNPLTNSLLLACKEYPGKGLKNSHTVYSFSLETKKLDDDPLFIIPDEVIKRLSDTGQFNPSAIEYEPTHNVFFILGGKSRLIAEISPEGKITDVKPIDKKNHPQPEGITFLHDGRLLISDEGNTEQASITIYSLK